MRELYEFYVLCHEPRARPFAVLRLGVDVEHGAVRVREHEDPAAVDA